MKEKSLIYKIILWATFLLSSMSVMVIIVADNNLYRIIDKEQRTSYSNRLASILSQIEFRKQRLEQTMLQSYYKTAFQRSELEQFNRNYYAKFNTSIYPFIVDSDGAILAHPVYLRKNEFLKSSSYILKIIESKNGEFEYTDEFGEKRWVIFRQFTPWQWYVAYSVPLDVKYADVRVFRRFLAGLLFISFAVVIIIFALLIYKFLRPIYDLTVASEAMSQGNLLYEVSVDQDDEVGHLARNFVQMRNVVKEKIDELNREIIIKQKTEKELTRHRYNMERLIRERTIKLEESQKRFEDIALSSGGWVWEIDRDFKYTFVAGNVKEMLGRSESDLLGMTPLDIMSIEEKMRMRGILNRIYSTGDPIVDLENVKLSINGKEVWLVSNGIGIWDTEGNLLGYRGVDKDITQRKKMEKALAEQTTQLMRSNVELEEFAFIASHDLQEPLRKIEMFGNQLVEYHSSQLDGEGVDYLNRMKNAAMRMRVMINDLLQLSRISRKPFTSEMIVLNDIFDELLVDLEVAIKQKKATVIIDQELPKIKGDRSQLKQLFLNLLSNSLKYFSPDRPLIIEISGRTTTKLSKEYAIISVKDNGIGFDEKYAERIFAPFERLHAVGEYEGSGIGLAVCAKIVKRHGGKIAAMSVPGEATTFIVTFPLYPDRYF